MKAAFILAIVAFAPQRNTPLSNCVCPVRMERVQVPAASPSVTLPHQPNPAASLLCYRNGLIGSQPGDYTAIGATVRFLGDIQPTDLLVCVYVY